MEFSPHHTKAFIKAYKRVIRIAEKDGVEAARFSFRDEMLLLGHEERVRNLYRIKDKLSAQSKFFVPNDPQEKYLATKSGKDIILKPRQIGFTTLSCVRALDLALWVPNVATGIMAHEQNKVQTIFSDNTKFTYQHFKKDWGHLYSPVDSSDSSTALTFKNDGMGRDLNSSMRVLFDFRGKTVQFLHVSEAAFIAADRLTGSLNGVPETGEIVLESTANGMGGEFYRQWNTWRKMGGLAPYKGHFTPWFEFYPEEPENWELSETENLTDYEQALVEFGKLQRYHIAWRRYKIEQSCQGNPEVFDQEYPSNDIDCFLSGQSLVFTASIIKAQQSNVRPPTKVGFLLSDGKGGTEFHPDVKGVVAIWETPDVACEYTIGADPSGGIGKDFAAAYVLNRRNGKIVARLYGQLEPADFATDLYKLATYYNKAWINPESNNHGHVVILVLKQKGYRNLYKRRELDTLTNQVTTKVGWITTNESKLTITEKLKTALKDGKVVVHDDDLIREMSTFVQVASKNARTIRREASQGAHDDLVIAACLAWEMHDSLGEVNREDERDADDHLDGDVSGDADTGFAFGS